jgi:cytochrome oxidase Cu insertion factor (SCO1/SenC/PrrC family)
VQPVITTAELGWQVEGNTRRWWLWVVSPDCTADCQQTVQHMQALHILLNREMDRVRRGYTAIGVTEQTRPQWMTPFPELAMIDIADASPLTEGVYIVDPNGNLVFHYSMDTNPKLVLQDLKKLLKVSHIG